MKLTVKLFATLQKYAPDGEKAGQPFQVTLPEGSTVGDLMDELEIPREAFHIAYVDGRACREDFELQPGTEVGLFPPVGGG